MTQRQCWHRDEEGHQYRVSLVVKPCQPKTNPRWSHFFPAIHPNKKAHKKLTENFQTHKKLDPPISTLEQSTVCVVNPKP